MAISPQTYINQLRETNSIESPANATVAQTIMKDITTTFIDKFCFIRELLQNINDSAAVGQREVSVFFSLVGNELIVSHNGRPFNEKDVKKICSHADVASNEKGDDPEQTGYKDIGFKSIFAIAYLVHILSGQWKFHFNENNPLFPKKGNESTFLPWPIVPFCTEEKELSLAGKEAFKSSDTMTSFVCSLRNPQEIEAILYEFAQQPEQLIFLKRVNALSIEINGKQFSMDCKNAKLCINGTEFSDWTRINHSVKLPPWIIKELLNSSIYAYPRKLRGQTEVEISCCYFKKDGKFVVPDKGGWFCNGLPATSTNFPGLAQGPFSLNTSREALLVNELNKFLICEIAKLNFEFVRQIISQEPSVLRILALTVLTGVNEDLKNCFAEQMKSLVTGEPLLPSYLNSHTLKVGYACVDTSSFINILLEFGLQFHDFQRFVHPNVASQELLDRFPEIQRTGFDFFIPWLPTLMQGKNIKLCAKILSFFSHIFRHDKSFSREQFNFFMNQPFVLNSQGELSSLRQLFLPYVFNNNYSLPPCVIVDVIHPGLMNTAILEWLQSIDLKYLTADVLVDTYAKNLMHDSLKNLENNRAIVRLFYSFYRDKLIDFQNLKKLRGLCLMNSNKQYCSSYNLYLSSFFAPKLPLEDNLTGIFVNTYYVEPGENIELWKNFLLTLGVREKCDLGFNPTRQIKKINQHLYGWTENYISQVTLPVQRKVDASKDWVAPFIFFPFMQAIPFSPILEKQFWDQLAKHQSKILAKYNEETYHTPTKAGKQPHTYLQYVLKTQNLVCNNQNGRSRIQDLYAPSMLPIIGDRLPVALIPSSVKLVPEMEAFLGFKTILDLQECYNSLYALQRQYNYDSYKVVMKQILANLKKDVQSKIVVETWSFQASNGEWRPASQLKRCTISNPPPSAEWLKPVFSNSQELEEFCNYLEINPPELQQQAYLKNAQPCDVFKEFLLEKLPYIAFYWADVRRFDQPSQQIVGNLFEKINSLHYLKNEGPMMVPILDEQTLCYDNWEDQLDDLITILIQYFRFESKEEKNSLKKALKGRQMIPNNKKGLFQEYQEVCKKMLDASKVNVPPRATTPPLPAITPQVSSASPPIIPAFSDLTITAPPQTPPPGMNGEPGAPWDFLATPPLPPTPVTGIIPSPLKSPPQQRKPTKTPPKPPVDPQGEPDQTARDLHNKRKGLKAEQHVAKILEDRYAQKLKEGKIKSYQVIWHNNPANRPADKKNDELWDSERHHDIEVRIQREGQPERIKKYEVKGTKESKAHFHFSQSEYKSYSENPANYRIWVITNIETDHPKLVKIKNFIEHLKEKKIFPISSMEFSSGNLEGIPLEGFNR